MPPESGAAPGAANQPPAVQAQPAQRHNPTVLDTIFILLASVTLLLLLFWIVSEIGGKGLFKDLPPWLKSMISSVWAKVGIGSGAAGSLILRKWLEDEPAPNYLVWIPGFLGFLLAAIFAVALLMRFIAPPPVLSTTPTVYPSSMILKVQKPAAGVGNVLKVDEKLQIKFQEQNPLTNTVYLSAKAKDDYTFLYKSSYKTPPGGNVVARFNWVRKTAALSSGRIFDYEICLKPVFQALTTDLTMSLECAGDACKSAKEDPHLMVGCDQAARFHLIPLAYAFDTASTSGPQRWVVPSLETLQKIPDAERVGYTHFEIEYHPSAAAQAGDSYYYAIFVNDQSVYIDGFPPDSLKAALAHDKNLIQFGLENLNFSGQNSGNEKIRVTLVILQEGREILRQELERDYAALRDASSIVLQNPAGKFIWGGAYVKPKIENRYEVFVSSTPNPKLAMNAKAQFEGIHVSFQGKPIVMVVRPPLGKNVNYGLVLGEVQPTSQVQFTFSKEEALTLCKWANGQDELIHKKRLIRKDLILYDNSKRGGYSACR